MRRDLRLVITLIPLFAVNLVAVFGQLAFLRQHLSWGLPGDILFAGALESVAVYLAYHAHIALIDNDSALRLRLASYLFGAVIGLMNYSHYAHDWRPDFEALAVGLMSASSPFLWGIHSRRTSRSALLSRGLIEPHALRLGMTRWTWHPIRSARVMFHATWTGEQNPAEAIALLSPQVTTEITPVLLADMKTKADAVRYAVKELARLDHGDVDRVSAPEVARWITEHASELPNPDWSISLSYAADVIRRDGDSRARISRARVRSIGSEPARRQIGR